MRTLALLSAIARSNVTQPGAGWELVIVHHTDCGISRLLDYPDALAAELGSSPEALDHESITDPRASLIVDIAALRANPLLPPGLIVSGLLYHTDTGRLDIGRPVRPRPAVVEPAEHRSSRPRPRRRQARHLLPPRLIFGPCAN